MYLIHVRLYTYTYMQSIYIYVHAISYSPPMHQKIKGQCFDFFQIDPTHIIQAHFSLSFFSVENIWCVLSDLVLKSSSNEADQVNDTQGSILSATWASLTVFLLFYLFCFPFSFSFIVSFLYPPFSLEILDGNRTAIYRAVWAHRSSSLIDSNIFTTFSSGAELNSVGEKIKKKGSHSQDFLLYISLDHFARL